MTTTIGTIRLPAYVEYRGERFHVGHVVLDVPLDLDLPVRETSSSFVALGLKAVADRIDHDR